MHAYVAYVFQSMYKVDVCFVLLCAAPPHHLSSPFLQHQPAEAEPGSSRAIQDAFPGMYVCMSPEADTAAAGAALFMKLRVEI